MNNGTMEPNDLAVAINQAHGQAVESKHVIGLVADQVRNPLASLAGQSQTVINKAGRAALDRLAKTAGKAQGVIDGIVQDLSAKLHSTIESAAIPLIELGVDLPTNEQIATIKSQLTQPPSIQYPAAPIHGTCTPHALPDAEKVYYLDLASSGGEFLVFPVNGYPSGWALVHRYTKWWRAELACQLLNECHMGVSWINQYNHIIETVDIFTGQSADMKALCQIAIPTIAGWKY